MVICADGFAEYRRECHGRVLRQKAREASVGNESPAVGDIVIHIEFARSGDDDPGGMSNVGSVCILEL